MKPTLRPYFDYIMIAALAILSYALFFHGLGAIGFIGPDEPRYAAIAREMLRTADYITPRLYGMPWFEKPPLMYWLAVLGYKLFGVNEAGARFPSWGGGAILRFPNLLVRPQVMGSQYWFSRRSGRSHVHWIVHICTCGIHGHASERVFDHGAGLLSSRIQRYDAAQEALVLSVLRVNGFGNPDERPRCAYAAGPVTHRLSSAARPMARLAELVPRRPWHYGDRLPALVCSLHIFQWLAVHPGVLYQSKSRAIHLHDPWPW